MTTELEACGKTVFRSTGIKEERKAAINQGERLSIVGSQDRLRWRPLEEPTWRPSVPTESTDLCCVLILCKMMIGGFMAGRGSESSFCLPLSFSGGFLLFRSPLHELVWFVNENLSCFGSSTFGLSVHLHKEDGFLIRMESSHRFELSRLVGRWDDRREIVEVWVCVCL